jgi:hypothetical protein
MSEPKTETRYEITVWNTFTGDIERKWWRGTAEDLDEAEMGYLDKPWFEVIVDREWEAEVEEEEE